MSDLEYEDLLEMHLFRNYKDLLNERQNSKYETRTSKEQDKVEKNVLQFYKLQVEPAIDKYRHIHFLKNSLRNLSKNYECLDSSRPWLCYWILHSLHILNARLEEQEYSNVVKFLAKCQSPNGGFSGGPGQFPHLASTYAAINALCIIGTIEAYDTINRKTLSTFLKSLRNSDGSFNMHVDGEFDIRGVYCALVVAKLTNVYTPELFKNTDKWIAQCQTWEGGFGGCPGMEAHGGYAYCGLAALVMLEKTKSINFSSFLRWIVNKQMRLEGGFQGRTNKLVDGCYSFWQGGAFPLIHEILEQERNMSLNQWLFDQEALQEYLLICCQHPHGGLLDKPGKVPDIYHTCYTLSGLSIAQHSPQPIIIGQSELNLVQKIHPVYNLVYSTALDAIEHFTALSLPD